MKGLSQRAVWLDTCGDALDLVLLDLSMPGMHGFDVLQEIRLTSTAPVIFLTVEDDELAKVRGLQLGGDDYIVKPFGHMELLARIRSVLRPRRGTRSRWNSRTSTATCRLSEKADRLRPPARDPGG